MMGKHHNRRVNPNKPQIEHIVLTTKQLNIRAIITARQTLEAVLTISETVGKGPMITGNAMNEETLVTWAGWRFRPDYETPPKPDVVVQFIPNLTKEMGELGVQPFFAPWEWPDKTEIIEKFGVAIAQIQSELSYTTERVSNDIKKQRDQGGVYFP